MRRRPNIPLSALSSSAQLANLNTHTPYIPPHPQRGTSYHRYTTLLLPQRFRISVPVLSQKQRCGFDVRTFIEKYKFEDSKGGGIHMFREVWNEEVSNIYQEILGTYNRISSPPMSWIPMYFLFISRSGGAEVRQAKEGRSLCRAREAIRTVVLFFT